MLTSNSRSREYFVPPADHLCRKHKPTLAQGFYAPITFPSQLDHGIIRHSGRDSWHRHRLCQAGGNWAGNVVRRRQYLHCCSPAREMRCQRASKARRSSCRLAVQIHERRRLRTRSFWLLVLFMGCGSSVASTGRIRMSLFCNTYRRSWPSLLVAVEIVQPFWPATWPCWPFCVCTCWLAHRSLFECAYLASVIRCTAQ